VRQKTRLRICRGQKAPLTFVNPMSPFSLFQPDYALYFAAPAGVINLWALIELGFLRGSLGPNRFGDNPTGIEVPPPLPAG
jgi:uncharacterized membrane protein YhaH (DUF805 family)